jgi:hypothetical protein
MLKETAKKRDAMLAGRMKAEDEELKVPEQERRKTPLQPANMKALFLSLPYMQWLYGYDVIRESRRWCEENMKYEATRSAQEIRSKQT